jgi:hypothetical protein
VLNVAKEQEPKDAAVEALGKMDVAALPTLTKEFEKKTTEENATFQSNLVAMGELEDEKTGLPYLRKLLKHKSIDVVASAGEALSNYKESPFRSARKSRTTSSASGRPRVGGTQADRHLVEEETRTPRRSDGAIAQDPDERRPEARQQRATRGGVAEVVEQLRQEGRQQW